MKRHVLFVLLALLPFTAAAAPPATSPAGLPAILPNAIPLAEDTAQAVRSGGLSILVDKCSDSILPREMVRVEVRVPNTTGRDLSLPYLDVIEAAEIVPEGAPTKSYIWVPRNLPDIRDKRGVIRAGNGDTWVSGFWFANEPLPGLPSDRPLLPCGNYRWRIITCTDPPIVTSWNKLHVGIPGLSDELADLYVQRPKGHMIHVGPRPEKPVAIAGYGEPWYRNDLLEAIRASSPGDTLILDEARTWELESLGAVPNDVWIIGRGAGRTVIKLTGAANDVPLLTLFGNQRLEGVTLLGTGAGHAALVRVEGKDAVPTLFRCALVPSERSFAAIECWHGAAPVLRNCVVISPVGDYGIFAREESRPRIEYCTIVSRGFGVGMMDKALPTIKRSLIVGQCPGILSDDGEFAISDSLVWCRPASTTFPDPVMRSRLPDGSQGFTSMAEVLQSPGMGAFDPGFAGKGAIFEYLQMPATAPGAGYGAFAGENGAWGTEVEKPAAEIKLNLEEILAGVRK